MYLYSTQIYQELSSAQVVPTFSLYYTAISFSPITSSS
jgi:hypothetical protein